MTNIFVTELGNTQMRLSLLYGNGDQEDSLLCTFDSRDNTILSAVVVLKRPITSYLETGSDKRRERQGTVQAGNKDLEKFVGDVLVFLNFWHFSPECTQTGSLGTTESEVWIGNLNVKARKTTEHKLNKIWRSLKFCIISAKWAHPRNRQICSMGTNKKLFWWLSVLLWCIYLWIRHWCWV